MKIKMAEVYNAYIDKQNEKNNKERYVGNESYFHGSSAGKCIRKQYYSSVAQIAETNQPSEKSKRVMRFGTIFHEDIQTAVDTTLYNIYNNIYNNINIYIEEELKIESLNVRGFSDLILEINPDDEDRKVILYDFKTIGMFPFSIRFGFKPGMEPDEFAELQIATYGLAVKERFGQLDEMILVFFEKNDQRMREVNVPLRYLVKARNYWEKVNRLAFAKSKPPIDGVNSPSAKWECKWSKGKCNYYDVCIGDTNE